MRAVRIPLTRFSSTRMSSVRYPQNLSVISSSAKRQYAPSIISASSLKRSFHSSPSRFSNQPLPSEASSSTSTHSSQSSSKSDEQQQNHNNEQQQQSSQQQTSEPKDKWDELLEPLRDKSRRNKWAVFTLIITAITEGIVVMGESALKILDDMGMEEEYYQGDITSIQRACMSAEMAGAAVSMVGKQATHYSIIDKLIHGALLEDGHEFSRSCLTSLETIATNKSLVPYVTSRFPWEQLMSIDVNANHEQTFGILKFVLQLTNSLSNAKVIADHDVHKFLEKTLEMESHRHIQDISTAIVRNLSRNSDAIEKLVPLVPKLFHVVDEIRIPRVYSNIMESFHHILTYKSDNPLFVESVHKVIAESQMPEEDIEYAKMWTPPPLDHKGIVKPVTYSALSAVVWGSGRWAYHAYKAGNKSTEGILKVLKFRVPLTVGGAVLSCLFFHYDGKLHHQITYIDDKLTQRALTALTGMMGGAFVWFQLGVFPYSLLPSIIYPISQEVFRQVKNPVYREGEYDPDL